MFAMLKKEDTFCSMFYGLHVPQYFRLTPAMHLNTSCMLHMYPNISAMHSIHTYMYCNILSPCTLIQGNPDLYHCMVTPILPTGTTVFSPCTLIPPHVHVK